MSGEDVAGIVLVLLAAVVNACSTVLQRRAARDEPEDAAFSIGMLFDLVRRPSWVGGILCMILGFLLQAAALTVGRIAVVQPLLTAELPLTLLLAAWVFGHGLPRREWVAIGAMALGLACFVFCLAPSGGEVLGVPVHRSVIALAIGLAAVVALALVGRTRHGQPRQPRSAWRRAPVRDRRRPGRGSRCRVVGRVRRPVHRVADLRGDRARPNVVLPAPVGPAGRGTGRLPARVHADEPARRRALGSVHVRRATAWRGLGRRGAGGRSGDHRRGVPAGALARPPGRRARGRRRTAARLTGPWASAPSPDLAGGGAETPAEHPVHVALVGEAAGLGDLGRGW